MKDTTMSNRPTRRFEILLTEVRVYKIEIGSDTAYDLEDWAREGWENSHPDEIDRDGKLVERRIAKISVQETSNIPWMKEIAL